MRSYIERAKDFIEQVYPYISECYNPWDMRNLIKNFNKTFDRKVIVSNGLSRIALITSDYVVKFDYDLDEVDNIGGCNNEVELYENAKREGFAYMFAEITPILIIIECFTSCPASVASVAVECMPKIIWIIRNGISVKDTILQIYIVITMVSAIIRYVLLTMRVIFLMVAMKMIHHGKLHHRILIGVNTPNFLDV